MREISGVINAQAPVSITTRMEISTMVSGQMIAGLGADGFSRKKDQSLVACLLKIKLMDMLNSKIQKAICSKPRMRRPRQAKLRHNNAAKRKIVRSQRGPRKTMVSKQAVLQMANYISKLFCCCI